MPSRRPHGATPPPPGKVKPSCGTVLSHNPPPPSPNPSSTSRSKSFALRKMTGSSGCDAFSFPAKLKAVPVRQVYIQNCQIKTAAFQKLPCLSAVVSGNSEVTAAVSSKHNPALKARSSSTTNIFIGFPSAPFCFRL